MTSAKVRGGMGFGGWLLLAFIVLKLTGYITWPWIWVLAPFWIPLSVMIVVLILTGIVWLVATLLSRR